MADVALVLPTYRRPGRLGRALASALGQTAPPRQVVVVDDGSEEAAENEAVVRSLAGRGTDLRYVCQEHRGAPAARNRGVRETDAAWVAFLDDDDEWLPGKLEQQDRVVRRGPPDLGLVYGWADVVDGRGVVLEELRPPALPDASEAILYRCFPPSPTVMVRRDCFERTGLFDESFPSCQDWEMWTRVAQWYAFGAARMTVALHRREGGPSVGHGEGAVYGYYAYYRKYADLYRTGPLRRELADKLAWLGAALEALGDADKAAECYERSRAASRWHPKSRARMALAALRRLRGAR